MLKVTKELKFCGAHRLLGYNGPCKNIHGHNYRVFITVESWHVTQGDKLLNNLGLLIDFKQIKDIVQTWIDTNLDHAIVIHKDDSAMIKFASAS